MDTAAASFNESDKSLSSSMKQYNNMNTTSNNNIITTPPISSSKQPSIVGVGTGELHALQIQEQHTLQRILHLEAIISDTTLGVVSRTKAKVELALLKKDTNNIQHNFTSSELDALKRGGHGVQTIKSQIENDEKDRLQNELALRQHLEQLYLLAMQQRDTARKRLLSARLRTEGADMALVLAEQEAEQAMELVKVAMNKLNEARVNAGKEKKLYEEAKLIEVGCVAEVKRLGSYGEGGEGRDDDMEGGNNMDITSGDSSSMGGDRVRDMIKKVGMELNAINASLVSPGGHQLAKEQLEREFEDREKYWEMKCMELTRKCTKLEGSLNESQRVAEHAQHKIISLELYVNESVDKEVYWKGQSTKLSSELQDLKGVKLSQEEQLQDLKKKITIEDNQMAQLKVEIDELKGMKLILEQRQHEDVREGGKGSSSIGNAASDQQQQPQDRIPTDKNEEDSQLDALTHEIMKLISDKEDALSSVTNVKERFVDMLHARETKILDLQRDVDICMEELQDAQTQIGVQTRMASDLQVSMDTMEVTTKKEKDVLLNDQARVVGDLESEIERISGDMAELEDTVEEQRKLIKKLKKSKKEAMLIQDHEIQRLKASLNEEVEKSEKLAFDLNHWKTSATDLSKTTCVLEKQRDELKASFDAMQSKLNKQVMQLKMEVSELKKMRPADMHYTVTAPSRELLDNRFVKDQRHIDPMSPMETDEDLDEEIDTIFRTDGKKTPLNDVAKFEASASPARRPRRSTDSNGPVRRASTDSNGPVRRASTDSNASVSSKMRSSLKSLKSSFTGRDSLRHSSFDRRDTYESNLSDHSTSMAVSFTDHDPLKQQEFVPAKVYPCRRRASMNDLQGMNGSYKPKPVSKSLSDSLKHSTFTAPSCDAKLFDVSALEGLLVDLLADRDRLALENEHLKEAGLVSGSFDKKPKDTNETSDKDNKKRKSSKKDKSKIQVYQLSYKAGGVNYIGKTRKGVKRAVENHCDDIWDTVQKGASDESKNEDRIDGEDFADSKFARHFARHCRNAKSHEEVIQWCNNNIKVQQGHKIDEDKKGHVSTRNVYQMSCKGCESDLHFIGSTHKDLNRTVGKHFKQIYNLVNDEYGEDGFTKDTGEKGTELGDFRSSALHFAKHCKGAKTKEEVKAWCYENIRVERWTMICRTCLGTNIEQGNAKGNVMAIKNQVKFDRKQEEDKNQVTAHTTSDQEMTSNQAATSDEDMKSDKKVPIIRSVPFDGTHKSGKSDEEFQKFSELLKA